MGGSRADSAPGLAGRFPDGAVEPVEGVGQRDLQVERADLVLAFTVADGRITAITAVIDPAVSRSWTCRARRCRATAR
ncbi:hypothetical protein ACWGIV_21760 [Streptomyces sp. NPDC054844]